MGSEDGSGHVVMQRYRLRSNATATEDDFDEYLSDQARFFEMFRPFMHEQDRLEWLLGGSIVLARNTFVFNMAQPDWAEHLRAVGAIALTDERQPVERFGPTPIENLT
jgi:hypothetical protein